MLDNKAQILFERGAVLDLEIEESLEEFQVLGHDLVKLTPGASRGGRRSTRGAPGNRFRPPAAATRSLTDVRINDHQIPWIPSKAPYTANGSQSTCATPMIDLTHLFGSRRRTTRSVTPM